MIDARHGQVSPAPPRGIGEVFLFSQSEFGVVIAIAYLGRYRRVENFKGRAKS
jgi:hypothetical protein